MKLAICDDDKDFLNSELELVESVLAEIGADHLIRVFTSPEELIGSGEKYDIVFLDIETGSMTGIEAADAIHALNKNTLIFFATNHEGYMDEALNKHAFRFWVKPLNRQRLVYGLQSAIKELDSLSSVLKITTGRRIRLIPVSDIIYIYAKNKNTCIVTADEELTVKEPLKNILSRLNKTGFSMSHASYCINLAYVVKYTGEEVVCRSGEKTFTAYMSKRRYGAFSADFIKWAGEHI